DLAHRRARDQMADLADLVGAVRLPNSAHQAAAGTEVVTDLLILRRRPTGQPLVGPAWQQARSVDLPTAGGADTVGRFDVNEYFLTRPEMVLGEQVVEIRQRAVLTVRPSEQVDTAAALRAALDRLTPPPQVVLRSVEPELQEGLFLDEGNGRFSQVR